MLPRPLPAQTVHLLQAARQLGSSLAADAILLITGADLDWEGVRALLGSAKLLVVATEARLGHALRTKHKLDLVVGDFHPMPMKERINLCLLEALAAEQLPAGATVVVVYNGIEMADDQDQIDTISVIKLGENLERLRAQDLRKLDTQVPLETLKAVVDFATELGREGREGKPVGTIVVVGDTRKVMASSRVLGFDPVRGYSHKERNLRDRRVRESLKEIAKLDGAIIVDKDGTVVAAARYLDVVAEGITLSKGLGSRHWAAAGTTRRTHAIAVVVSESTGVVRIFQNGQVVLHIAPYARPILWRQIRETDEGLSPVDGRSSGHSRSQHREDS
ncbi:MAG TPA: DNA integrity scanning protein DisA nucleotide-binding domain protein [Gemmatales bacterium]|nr:DNA integrity scanning protein DisA nucleotide-binding domain protein [Gemmatales bacterium]